MICFSGHNDLQFLLNIYFHNHCYYTALFFAAQRSWALLDKTRQVLSTLTTLQTWITWSLFLLTRRRRESILDLDLLKDQVSSNDMNFIRITFRRPESKKHSSSKQHFDTVIISNKISWEIVSIWCMMKSFLGSKRLWMHKKGQPNERHS